MSLHKLCFLHSNSDFPDLQFDQLSEEDSAKTLGVLWNGSFDAFYFTVHIAKNLAISKRNVLSQTARLFDPLGLLGCVISKATFFIQGLWLLKIDWHTFCIYQ
ncbi:uncharacterized protein NPIL_700851 [Nephila pilipes]|uniref:Uncharacterized protein n=1 Tax=Nephila pilipes TaxID=299642 RepID=A0A8X6MXJ2_NEPPI|nr:uncharacterized protein NPIL_700851 [Nephila pilipes]